VRPRPLPFAPSFLESRRHTSRLSSPTLSKARSYTNWTPCTTQKTQDTYSFNSSTMQFETSTRAARDYKTVASLFVPRLVTYFNILSAHASVQSNRTVPFVFFQFINHFQKISSKYKWTAVVEYTLAFLASRRLEMLEQGDYSKWAYRDSELAPEHLLGNKKILPASSKSASSAKSASTSASKKDNAMTICRNFNAGTCTQTPCPCGRIHQKIPPSTEKST